MLDLDDLAARDLSIGRALSCLMAILALALALAPSASAQEDEPPAPPSNDAFSAATDISGDEISRPSDSNVSASKEAGEPDHAGYTGGASVWYRWTSPQSRPVIVDTFGSSFDTTLAVYRGSSVSSLTEVKSNDDSGDPRGTFQSELRFDADAGQTYLIAVDGYVSPEGEVAQGTVALALRQLPPPPETVIESGPTGTVPASQTDARFEFSGAPTTDSYECRLDSLDDDDWASCSTPLELAGLDQGEHLLEVRGRNAGGVDATPATREWIVGAPLPPPDTTILSAPPAEVDHTQRTANFTFEADGRTRGFECRLDSGSWSPCATNLTLSDLGLGDHRFEVRALAPGGTPETTPAVHEWTIKPPPPPDTTITSAPPSETSERSARFEFAADSTQERFECRLDSNLEADWQICATPHSVSGLTAGAHRFEVRAVGLGGADASPAAFDWTVLRRNAPETTIIDGPTGTATTNEARFEFTGAGDFSGFECRLDSTSESDWRSCASPRTYRGLSDGQHTVEVRAVNEDAADATPATRTWTVDTLPPLADSSIDVAPPAQTSNNDARFEFSASGTVDRFECKLDDADWAECESPFDAADLADGEHSFAVRAINARGTETTPATHSWTVTPDPIDPPETTLDSAPAATTAETAADFSFSASGQFQGFECKLDAGAWESCSSPHRIAGLSVGAHQLAVRATGPGGADASPAVHDWTVIAPDPPDTAITGAPKKKIVTKASKVLVKLSFNSPTPTATRFECRLDAGKWVECRSPRGWFVKAAKKAQRHTLSVRAIDEAGQIDATPAKATFSVQKKVKKKRRRN